MNRVKIIGAISLFINSLLIFIFALTAESQIRGLSPDRSEITESDAGFDSMEFSLLKTTALISFCPSLRGMVNDSIFSLAGPLPLTRAPPVSFAT